MMPGLARPSFELRGVSQDDMTAADISSRPFPLPRDPWK
jgi:hypothetical protein